MDKNQRWIRATPELFFDNHLIEMVQDVRRVFHSPVKRPDPLITRDSSWEAYLSFNDAAWNVIHDTSEDVFRCWYEDAHFDFKRIGQTNVDITDPRVSGSRVCYATSPDGLNWIKPRLELMPVSGRPTNIVFGDWNEGQAHFGAVHAISVLDDRLDSDVTVRFKMLFQHITRASPLTDVVTDTGQVHECLQSPIRLASSPDGIHWRVDDHQLDFGGLGPRLGDVIRLTRDWDTGAYLLYTRHPNAWNPLLNPKNPHSRAWSLPYYPADPAKNNKRRIWLCQSWDLLHWSEPQEVLIPDDTDDNLDESFNSLGMLRIGNVRVGFLNVLHMVDGTADVQLVHSRDGVCWQRSPHRKSFLSTGLVDDWDAYMVSMPTAPIECGDELWLYYGGANLHHNWWLVGSREGLDLPEVHRPTEFSSGMGLAILRKDGFVSLNATVREGIVVTRPVRLSGWPLFFNARCQAGGYLDVEIVDADDNVIPGFLRSNFQRFSGDSTRSLIQWQGAPTIPLDRPVKLRFFMLHCDVYSICTAF